MRLPTNATALALSSVLLAAGASHAAHPQTVWDASELAGLQAARASTHAALADNLKVYLDAYAAAGLGANVAGYAMAARIWNQPAYTSAAVAKLAAFCNSGWQSDLDIGQAYDVLAGSIGYDVLHDLLSQAQRDACRNRIAASAASLAQAASNGTWWTTDMVQNHNWVNFASIGLAGQALEGEHASAAGWRALAEANRQKVKAIQDLIVDGSWHEGIGYLEFGLERSIAYDLGAARRGSTADKSNLLRGLGRYILSVQQPNHPRVHVMTHGDWNWSRPGLMVCLRWAGRRFQDPYAQEAARRWDLEPRLVRAEFGLSYALEYIAFDPAVPLPQMSTVPLDFYASDQQAAVMRSSWDFGAGAQSIVLGFKAGVFGGRGNYERMRSGGAPGWGLNISHDHEDDLGLWIYGKGGWLLPEAVAYNCCYGTADYHSTSWQNTFLFDGQGQLGDFKQPSLDYKSYGDGHPWFFEREASMPLHVSTEHYSFARGEGPKLYPAGLGVLTLSRTVALSRDPGYFALHDKVGLGSPRKIEQLFHAQQAASNAAPWVKLVNQNDTVLGIRVVAPASYAATVSTQQSNQYQENMDADGQFGLVKLAPVGPQTQTTFLEVLWPTTGAQWASRPIVSPLDPAAPARGFGVALGTASEAWIYSDAAHTTAGDLSLIDGTGQDIGIVRQTATGQLMTVVLQGQGRLLDQADTRLLLDLGTNRGALEVTFTGTRADLSGTSGIEGVRFHGPDVTEVYSGGAAVYWTKEGPTVTVSLTAPPADAGSGAPVVPVEGPVIGALWVEGRTSTTATVSWQTDKPASSQLEFGETTEFGASTAESADLVTTHRQVLSALSPGRTYHVRAKARDAAGLSAASECITVTLLKTDPRRKKPIAPSANPMPSGRSLHCDSASGGGFTGAAGLGALSVAAALKTRRRRRRD